MNLEVITVIVASLAALISVLSASIAFYRSRNSRFHIQVKEEDKPNQRSGLILLIGPLVGASPAAVEYHLPILKHCWLIGPSESVVTAEYLTKAYNNVAFHVERFINPDEISSTYSVISNIFEKELLQEGIKVDDVIGDITGGLKPMAAGMAIACISYQCNMQYMKALRDQSGEIIRNATPTPVKVDASFKSR